jgi:hypothetical protein
MYLQNIDQWQYDAFRAHQLSYPPAHMLVDHSPPEALHAFAPAAMPQFAANVPKANGPHISIGPNRTMINRGSAGYQRRITSLPDKLPVYSEPVDLNRVAHKDYPLAGPAGIPQLTQYQPGWNTYQQHVVHQDPPDQQLHPFRAWPMPQDPQIMQTQRDFEPTRPEFDVGLAAPTAWQQEMSRQLQFVRVQHEAGPRLHTGIVDFELSEERLTLRRTPPAPAPKSR